MRFLVKAKKDNPESYGDRTFVNKDGKPLAKGDEIELSGQGFELVMGKQYRAAAGDAFEFVKEIPETPEEERRAAPRLLKAELMEEKKADLVKDAKDLGLPTSLKKEDLVNEIVEAKTAEDERKEQSISTTLTAASGTVNPKAKRPGGKN